MLMLHWLVARSMSAPCEVSLAQFSSTHWVAAASQSGSALQASS